MDWARILAYVTGTVDQEFLLRNEYLVTENRILKAQLKGLVLRHQLNVLQQRAPRRGLKFALGRRESWCNGDVDHRPNVGCWQILLQKSPRTSCRAKKRNNRIPTNEFLNQTRCQRTRDSGRMIIMALRTDGHQRYSWMKNRRSLFVNWIRPRTLRCSTVS
jgi:hypothetical protein